jgi:hypothetical protein
MTDQLSLYNGALRLCKERRLASLTENRHPRRLLDDAWGDGARTGSVARCLEAGQWTFATRTGRIDATPDIAPDFGYRHAFTQPEDMVRPVAICQDEFFKDPLLDYSDERQIWYAPISTIYVKWVSNGDTYGADLSLWPQSFVDLVEADLAMEIVYTLTESADARAAVEKAYERQKVKAASMTAMNKPTSYPPEGGWNRARRGWGSNRQSGWNGHSL